MADMKILFTFLVLSIALYGCSSNEIKPEPTELDLATNFAKSSFETYAGRDCELFFPLFSQDISLMNGTNISKSKELKYRLCDLMANVTVNKDTKMTINMVEGRYLAEFSTEPKISFIVARSSRGWQIFGMSGIIPEQDLSLLLSIQ